MILVIGSILDTTAPKLVSEFNGDAVLLTSLDLSTDGTSVCFHEFHEGIIMAQGQAIPVRTISGVVGLVAGFYPQELIQVNLTDREYVCREMNAFMFWFLSQLRCPKLNRPSVNCFSGPFWKTETWFSLAKRAGIPCAPVKRDNNKSPKPPSKNGEELTRVTVIGREFSGSNDERLHHYSSRLARDAHLDLLTVFFAKRNSRDYEFRGASQFPDLSDGDVLRAVPKFFSNPQML